MNWLARYTQNIFSSLRTQADTLNRVEISRDDILHNLAIIQSAAPGLAIFPVLKSNAYGHGLREVSEILTHQPLNYVLVDGYHEALTVREACSLPVLIMGPSLPTNIHHILKQGFSIAVNNLEQLHALVKIRRPATIHIALNTGMNREGFQTSDLDQVISILQEHRHINPEGIFSHFADADGDEPEFSEVQEQLFSDCLDMFENSGISFRWIHLGNSAGYVQTKDSRINAARPGIALYGYNQLPSRVTNPVLDNLKPALRLVSTITNIQMALPEEVVGYGKTHQVKEKTNIGVVPVGYYEGLDRKLSNVGHFTIDSKPYPIAGRVCMNLTCFDLGNDKKQVGDQIVIISNNLHNKNSVPAIAQLTDTIPYEVLVRINPTIRRVIV